MSNNENKKRKYDNIISDLDKVISKLNSVNTPIEESINCLRKVLNYLMKPKKKF